MQIEIKDFGTLVKYTDERNYSDEQLLNYFKDCIAEMWCECDMEKVNRIIVSPKIFQLARSASEPGKGETNEDAHTTFIPIELCDALEDTRVIFLSNENDRMRFYTHKN